MSTKYQSRNWSLFSCFFFLPCVHQEDCAVQNVWLMGGLSVLTSVPTTPQPICLLCSSKGRHEVIQLLTTAWVVWQSTESVTDDKYLQAHVCNILVLCHANNNISVTKLVSFGLSLLSDDILPDLLWAFPQFLPLTRGAPHEGEQGELVLQALQILSCLWPSKQEHKGMRPLS